MKSYSTFPRVAVIAACMLVSWAAIWGQATTSLRGTIFDAAGSSIPGASVLLQGAGTGFRRVILTDDTGVYQFVQVPPGAYTLTIDKAGFSTAVNNNLQLQVNTPATVNLTLQVGAVTESVSVEAEAAKINAVNAAMGNAFNQTQVRQLPLLTRNVVELLSLQPGVTPTGEVLGARRDQNNITLDGVDVNDNQTAGLENSKGNAAIPGYNISTNGVDRPAGFNAALPVPLDSVQEFRVTVGGQEANQGRSSGGQVTLVTKSGTNNLHGSAYEYHRNTVTSANNWFSNRAGIAREKLIRNQFGASVGGPIIKDRAFFFGNYEQRIDASAANQLRKVPSESLKQGIVLMQATNGTTQTITPAQVKAIDPLHIGESATMLNIFKQLPVGNDPASGLDRGLNFSAFRFNAPLKLDYKAYVAKMDFHIDPAGKHNLSVRGTLADNVNDEILAQYPGQAPAAKLLNNSRGLSATYTTVLTPALVNVASFGLTRIGLERTGAVGTGLTFDNIDNLTNFTRGLTRIAPTYNITDDITWTKGPHTVTTGANIRFIRNQRVDFKNAFPSYSISRSTLQGLGADIVTAAEDFTGLRSSSAAVLSRSIQQVTGVVNSGSMTYSYGRDGTPLAIGTPPKRQFNSNEFELYVSDSWRVKPSFTLTYGIRYSKYGVPYESSGLQVAPLFPLEAFYAERLGGMQAGIPTNALPHALMQYDFNGPVNGKSSWFKPDNNNFAPRLAWAYSPSKGDHWYNKILGKGGVIRGGAAVVYDRFGSDLVTQFDSNASFGLTDVKNLGQSFTFTTGSRYDGTLPAIPNAPKHTFPFTPPEVNYLGGSYMGISTNLRTPYSYVMNASVARELPGGLTMEIGYAGRLSRKLLMQIDAGGWALLFKDLKSGQNWKEMANQIRQLHDGGLDPRAVTTNPGLVPLIPFIENMLPGLKDNYFPGSASANYYQLIWGQYSGSDADTVHAVDRLKSAKFPNCIIVTGCYSLYAVQSSANSMWTNTGFAAYHGGTLSIRRPFSKGFSFDLNYTLSHAIDNGGGPEAGGGQAGGIMLNPLNYRAFRGSSDFDMRHNLNANGLYELPFGKGKHFLSGAGSVMNQLVAGWQISTIMRYRSGLPTAVAYTGIWPTNYAFNTIAYPVGPYESKIGYNEFGNPSVFGSTKQAANWRPMNPGEVGQRAALRLDDLMNFDISVSKAFPMPWEGHRVQFRAEAFNAFNNVNFLNPTLDANSPSNFGQFTAAGAPRVMQFALRYEF
jgi:hypothetical protein